MTENGTQQILLPKKVYIGDSAELRCTFNSNSLDLKNFCGNETKTLSLNAFEAPADSQNYIIQNISLSCVGVDYYQLSITFVPWKTGSIHFPVYNVSSNFDSANALTSFTPADQIEIAFEPVEIVSIVEQNQVTGLSPSAPPMLLPGTTYKLYTVLILFVILILLLIRSITKREQEIIIELLNGKSNKELAEALFVSEKTIETHLANIYRKVGVKNRLELFSRLQND